MTCSRTLIWAIGLTFAILVCFVVYLIHMRSFPTNISFVVKDNSSNIICTGTIRLTTNSVHYMWQLKYPYVWAYSEDLTAVSKLEIHPALMIELVKWIGEQRLQEYNTRQCARLLVPTFVDSTGELDLSIGVHKLDRENWVALHWKTTSMTGKMSHWNFGGEKSQNYPIIITDVRY
jgi:hypothetical protein